MLSFLSFFFDLVAWLELAIWYRNSEHLGLCHGNTIQILDSSMRLLCSWNAGFTQVPQLHCIPAQLKDPRRALQPKHKSFSSTLPSSTACIHFIGSTNIEEQTGFLSFSKELLLFFHLKHCSPSPCWWVTTFSCVATILRHFLQRYIISGFESVTEFVLLTSMD